MKPETAEGVIRRLRQRMFDYTEVKQDQATRIIVKLKRRIGYKSNRRDYHWMYACE